MIHSPAPGQKIPILFDRDSGSCIPRKEARAHWRLFLALGCFCAMAGLALLLDGRGILSDLADYHVETPNLAGSVVCQEGSAGGRPAQAASSSAPARAAAMQGLNFIDTSLRRAQA